MLRRFVTRIGFVCLGLFSVELYGQGPSESELGAQLVEVPAQKSGIDFVHTDGGNGNRYIVETVTGGIATFDYDNDGLWDIYFLNGAPLKGSTIDPRPKSRLYRNLGNMRFIDVTDASGLGDLSYSMGVVVGDVDNDGDADVFKSNFGENTFYLNQGDGTFRESAREVGLIAGNRFGAGNAFLDMDGDGDLDLYSASYVEFDYSKHRTRRIAGHEFHLGPNDFPPAQHHLFKNHGDGTFSDVTAEAGILRLKAPGMGVLAADFDEDGDADIFVANDQKPNFLLLNDGKGTFREDGVLAGIAVDRSGKANGNMGVEYGDLNGDGLLDLVTTTFQDEMPVYYEALDKGLYVDSTNIAKIDPSLFAHVNWGVGVFDFDNDGDKDLYFANGHFLDNLHFIDDRTDLKVVNYLLANDGKGHFRNVTSISGSAMQVVESSRGAAFEDFDNDGAVDFVVLNVNARPTLAHNESSRKDHSVTLQLVGTGCNRDGVGASVTLFGEKGMIQRQVVLAGRGYESHYGSRLHFGLGTGKATRAVVLWPNGVREEFPVHAGANLLREGTGVQVQEAATGVK